MNSGNSGAPSGSDTGAFRFRIESRCPRSEARTGVFSTPHGDVPTPAFMPVGTRGTVKGVLPRDLEEAGATMILANTYHLHLRPGEETVRELGGLHRLMAWKGPILTDSGGYQVFSLGHMNQIDDDGVSFRSIVDGEIVRFTPERVIDIEHALGADVIMAFDHCPSNPLARAEVEAATTRTHRWLERCVARWHEHGALESGQALFGIVQGGAFEDLRRSSVDAVCSFDLPGYAIGGVSVGEGRDAMLAGLAASAPYLPESKPRYLMGVGTPVDFLDAIERGVDLFDCVTPTRHARNHQVYTSRGRINVRNGQWRNDAGPMDPECSCVACRDFNLGTLRHLCHSKEMLGGMLLTLHNLTFFFTLMRRIRAAIENGTLPNLRQVVEPMGRRVPSRT